MKKDEKSRVNILLSACEDLNRNIAKYPPVLDIHPVMNVCNLSCKWCVGKTRLDNTTVQRPIYMEKHGFLEILKMIFNTEKHDLFPQEVHFCGNNSEPLLNEDIVIEGIEYLKTLGVKTNIITNGLLIDKEMAKRLQSANTISISLDATSNFSYCNNKCLHHEYEEPFDKICQNIELLNINRRNSNTDQVISTSFLISDLDELNFDFELCLRSLSRIGVDLVKIRFDANNVSQQNMYSTVRKKIDEYNVSDSEMSVVCGFSDDSVENKIFSECYGPMIWPTLAANMKMYACAHCANLGYNFFLDLYNDNYYEYYQRHNNVLFAREINCDINCPPLLAMINSSMSYQQRSFL